MTVKQYGAVLAALALLSCSSVESRQDTAQSLMAEHNFRGRTLSTSSFPLFMAENAAPALNRPTLTVVIEGDGYAWSSRHKPSQNPTPRDPVGLKLALELGPETVYLARPCQYVTAGNCAVSSWTDDRFSDAVIRSYRDALDRLKTEHGNTSFHLVGFSGGAYVALRLAAEHADITRVTSVAGVPDPGAWTRLHGISPLNLSKDPASLLQASRNTAFEYYCGTDDDVAPCSLTQDFVRRAQLMGLQNHTLVKIESESHDSLWRKAAAAIRR